jgi:hypothetical protein
MGARFGSECYATDDDAAEAQCASTSGTSSAGVVSCTGVTEGLAGPELNLRWQDGETVTTAVVAFASIECDPGEQYEDLLAAFGFACVALVTVWCIKQFVLRLVMPQ